MDVGSKAPWKKDRRTTGVSWNVDLFVTSAQLHPLSSPLSPVYLVRCCFNWHEEKSSSYLAACSCFMSQLFSPPFLVPCPSFLFSVSLPLRLSLLFICIFLFLSLCLFLSVPVFLQHRNTAFPTDCLCCFPPLLSSLSSYLHLPASHQPTQLVSLFSALTWNLYVIAS